jgi:hypothetical protein
MPANGRFSVRLIRAIRLLVRGVGRRGRGVQRKVTCERRSRAVRVVFVFALTGRRAEVQAISRIPLASHRCARRSVRPKDARSSFGQHKEMTTLGEMGNELKQHGIVIRLWFLPPSCSDAHGAARPTPSRLRPNPIAPQLSSTPGVQIPLTSFTRSHARSPRTKQIVKSSLSALGHAGRRLLYRRHRASHCPTAAPATARLQRPAY